MAWRTFVQAHWPALRGADVFMGEVCRLRRLMTFYTALIAQLPPLTSGRFSAIGGKRAAEAHATLDEHIDDELGAAHSDLRRGFEEGWWQEPAARHSGRPRAPDVWQRAERRPRGTGRPASMNETSLIRSAA